MAKLFGVLLAIALGAYAFACAALFFSQRSFLYYPTLRTGHAPVEHLRRDGVDLVVSVRAHAGPRAVIYLGGNAEDVSQSVPLMAETFPDAAIHALHYRGYGGSTGQPTEKDLVADATSLFDQVHARHPDVTVIGRSLGSGVAIQLATRRPVSRLVLVTPYASIAELGAQHFRYLPVRWLLQDTYESRRFAPAVSIPTTVIAAGHDEVIPMASTRRLLAAFQPGIASFVVIRGAGHNDIAEHDEYAAALRESGP